MVISFSLRGVSLSAVPLLDGEALIGLASIGILEHGESVFPSGVPYNRGPLVLRVTAASFSMAGVNAFALRIPSVVVGTVSVPAIYALGATVVDRRTGIIAATLTTFSFVHISWSRTARFYIFLQLFLVLAVLAYFKFTVEKYDWRYLPPMVIAIVGAYFTHTGWLFIFVFLLIAILTPNLRELTRMDYGKLGVIGVGIVGVFIVTLTESLPFVDVIGHVIGLPLSGELGVWRHPRTDSGPASFFSSYFPLVTAIAGYGFVGAVRERNERAVALGGFLVLAVWIFTYFGADIRHVWRPRYLLVLVPFLFILAGHLNRMWDARTNGHSLVSEELIVAIAVLVFVVTPLSATIGFSLSPHTLSQLEEPQPNYLGACEEVGDQIHQSDIVITNRPAQVSFWFGKVDYRGNMFQVNRSGENRDRFTGIPGIPNESRMREVISSHDRVWVIYNQYLSFNGEQWVRENLALRARAESPFPSRFPFGLYPDLQNRALDETVFVYTRGIGDGRQSSIAEDGERITVRC
jgi:4-amino-4-deoxy-L-arabinose transferase-like glycosyltransferase